MTLDSDKKIVVFYVLDILKDFSDSEHLMTYKDILEKLDLRYGIRPDVKSIAKNIDTLVGAGYEIEKCGFKGCYLARRDFEKGELMYLIDAINSSTAIDPKQAKDLINKLTKDYSRYDKKKYNSVMKIDFTTSKSRNKELFYVIEILSEAIEQGKKVVFNYNEYNISKELHQKYNRKDYIINPYFLVNSRGKYYLVCNYDKYNNLSNYKVEAISNIHILDEDVKDIKKLDDAKGFSIKDYINEHIYMTYGDSVDAKLELENNKYIGEVIDWFGDKVRFSKSKDDKIIADLKVNEQALIYWALQYGEHIEILSPTSTREKMKESLKRIIQKYED